MNILLWIIQILLMLLFLAAGVTKLIMPTDALMAMAPPDAIKFPGWFLKFIGLAEVLGALGLFLPGVFRKRQELTPLAAAGLTMVMVGAFVVGMIDHGVQGALTPLIIGVLCAFVAYARWKVRPLR